MKHFLDDDDDDIKPASAPAGLMLQDPVYKAVWLIGMYRTMLTNEYRSAITTMRNALDAIGYKIGPMREQLKADARWIKFKEALDSTYQTWFTRIFAARKDTYDRLPMVVDFFDDWSAEVGQVVGRFLAAYPDTPDELTQMHRAKVQAIVQNQHLLFDRLRAITGIVL